MPRNHAVAPWRDRDASHPSLSPLLCGFPHGAAVGPARRLQTLKVVFDGFFPARLQARPAEGPRRPRVEASLFLLLRVFVPTAPAAAIRRLHAAATGLAVPLSLAVF